MACPRLVSRLSLALGAIGAVTTLLPRSALAGGYDTPILYSARHMGMGGTAIGYVNDPSAMFHNPAGLGGIRGLEVLGDISPLFGSITTSPGTVGDTAQPNGNYPTRTTEPAVSPLFMVGAGYRIADAVSIGMGFYPVAAAAGEYRSTDIRGRPALDKTRLVFLEFSPGLSVELTKGLYLGAGYRATIATLERVKGAEADPREFNFTVSGVDPAGFRAGLQWHINDNFSAGIVYRHKVAPKLKGDNVVAGQNDLTNGETTFVLPAKMGAGVKGRFDRLSTALDVEYGFYSQNTTTTLTGFNSALNKTEQVVNYFEWQNALTARVGLEYLLGPESQFPVRVGYVFDGKVGNTMYPTAFGTPPAPSHSITAGAGFRADKWQVNLAGAYRFASTSITPADVAGAQPCASCSKPGPDYSLKIIGLYLDFSYRFDVAPLFGGAAAAAPGGPKLPETTTPAPAAPPSPPGPTPASDPAPTPGPTIVPTPTPAPTPTP